MKQAHDALAETPLLCVRAETQSRDRAPYEAARELHDERL